MRMLPMKTKMVTRRMTLMEPKKMKRMKMRTTKEIRTWRNMKRMMNLLRRRRTENEIGTLTCNYGDAMNRIVLDLLESLDVMNKKCVERIKCFEKKEIVFVFM